jgi:Na+/pantothenate symporter
MFFSLASNILVVSSILIGGAAAINSLTGMSVYASLWLLPLSVSAYTMRGGLRATILTDYVSFILLLNGKQISEPPRFTLLLFSSSYLSFGSKSTPQET